MDVVGKVLILVFLIVSLFALGVLIDGALLQGIWNGFVVHHVHGTTRTSLKHAMWPGVFIACLCGAFAAAGGRRK